MRIEFSPAVEIALRKASAVAQGRINPVGVAGSTVLRSPGSRGAAEVRPLDLLHGLLDEDEGYPVVRALAAGVDMQALRRLFPSCAAQDETSPVVPLAAATTAILAHARDLARLHGADGSVSSDQLLLATLEIDAAARALLEGVGLNFAALKEQITPTAAPLRLETPLDLAPATDVIDTARILDASANRAREALRVLEDFTRFIRADSLLSSKLKALRHDLAQALEQLPDTLLLQARDTLHDVGTTITTPREQERASPRAVAQANAKRLQEALRSLEEFGKVLNPAFSAAIEQLRYQAYTLERALLGGTDQGARLADATLYVLVTEALCRASLVGTVREALAGGAQVIQLREKAMDDRTLLATARDLRQMTRSAGALFIVNDRPDIALLAEADGVHLGQDDLPIQAARRLLGPDALIGVSTHTIDQMRAAVMEGASYLGVGPAFASQTKEFSNLAGLEFVRQAVQEAALPAFVLGGVTVTNLSEVLAAGGRRVAVSHAVCAADDPCAVAAQLRRLLEGGRHSPPLTKGGQRG